MCRDRKNAAEEVGVEVNIDARFDRNEESAKGERRGWEDSNGSVAADARALTDAEDENRGDNDGRDGEFKRGDAENNSDGGGTKGHMGEAVANHRAITKD